jgi:ABC-2 type transport system permease protein
MIYQLWSIARNSFTESIRQPLFVVLILVGTLMLVLNVFLAAYTMEDDNKMLIDMGLSVLLTGGLFLAAFTATSVLSNELENKTVLTVVSKPVPRPVFVIGKYLGVIGALATAYWVLAIIFLFSARHQVMQTASDGFDGPVLVFGAIAIFGALLIAAAGNYLYQWVFTSTFVGTAFILATIAALMVLLLDRHWEFQGITTELTKNDGKMTQICMGLVLIFQALLVLSAVAIAASTRLGQVMNLVVCTGVFLFGLISDYLTFLVQKPFQLNISDTENQAASLSFLDQAWTVLTASASIMSKFLFFLINALYAILPNIQFFWPADALTQDHTFTPSYLAMTLGYSLLMTAGVLCLAVILFQDREVG